jgi:hypothetical protein
MKKITLSEFTKEDWMGYGGAVKIYGKAQPLISAIEIEDDEYECADVLICGDEESESKVVIEINILDHDCYNVYFQKENIHLKDAIKIAESIPQVCYFEDIKKIAEQNGLRFSE